MLILTKPPVAADTAAVTSVTGGTIRSDGFNYLGFTFTVQSTAITVTSLGRWKLSGNTATYGMGLSPGGNVAVSLVTTNVNMSLGSAGAFVYASCTPTLLSANTQYVVWVNETAGENWLDYDLVITSTAAIVINGASVGNNIFKSGVFSYVPPSFLYH